MHSLTKLNLLFIKTTIFITVIEGIPYTTLHKVYGKNVVLPYSRTT